MSSIAGSGLSTSYAYRLHTHFRASQSASKRSATPPCAQPAAGRASQTPSPNAAIAAQGPSIPAIMEDPAITTSAYKPEIEFSLADLKRKILAYRAQIADLDMAPPLKVKLPSQLLQKVKDERAEDSCSLWDVAKVSFVSDIMIVEFPSPGHEFFTGLWAKLERDHHVSAPPDLLNYGTADVQLSNGDSAQPDMSLGWDRHANAGASTSEVQYQISESDSEDEDEDDLDNGRDICYDHNVNAVPDDTMDALSVSVNAFTGASITGKKAGNPKGKLFKPSIIFEIGSTQTGKSLRDKAIRWIMESESSILLVITINIRSKRVPGGGNGPVQEVEVKVWKAYITDFADEDLPVQDQPLTNLHELRPRSQSDGGGKLIFSKVLRYPSGGTSSPSASWMRIYAVQKSSVLMKPESLPTDSISIKARHLYIDPDLRNIDPKAIICNIPLKMVLDSIIQMYAAGDVSKVTTELVNQQYTAICKRAARNKGGARKRAKVEHQIDSSAEQAA
ncbi:hypothetical protein BKA70DRAFT_1430613 [Coprinopsis sp. MPI-PUGE-AT-0042]|nr:hypothetical protein BKA70DRAFT_1430613 [Coprinopsis sp. MPI-PUGE-AT-0042]